MNLSGESGADCRLSRRLVRCFDRWLMAGFVERIPSKK
jgi:hypothetical protein